MSAAEDGQSPTAAFLSVGAILDIDTAQRWLDRQAEGLYECY